MPADAFLANDNFKDNTHGFEHFAAQLAKMRDSNVTIETVTRPSVDGGGDAPCKDRVGPIADQIALDFALEAKCYAWATESVSRNCRA
jgi:hypothetical protein